MSLRAFKLQLPEIKFLLHFFCVDKKGVTEKDKLIELLLDFLGVPDEKLTAAHQTVPKKKQGEDD